MVAQATNATQMTTSTRPVAAAAHLRKQNIPTKGALGRADDGSQDGEGLSKRRRLDDDRSTGSGPTTRSPTVDQTEPTDCPWMGSRTYSALPSVQQMLTQELRDFVSYIEPTNEEHRARQFVFEIVLRAIRKLWPDSQLTVFGSFRTRVYLPTR